MKYLSFDTLDFGFDELTNQQLERLFAELFSKAKVKPHLFTAEDVTRELRYRLTRLNNGIGFTARVRMVAAKIINVLYVYHGWKPITYEDLYTESYSKKTNNQLKNLARLYKNGQLRWNRDGHKKIIEQLEDILF